MGKVMIIGAILVAFVWVVFAQDKNNQINHHKGKKHHHQPYAHLDPNIKTCRDLPKQCCQGKDNTCRAHGKSMRENGKHKYCYCDSHCHATRDCCLDYEETCPTVDCVLGDWEDWGPCNKRCGLGEKTRNRTVLVQAMNGGQPCGTVQQKALCYGSNCKVARHSFGPELRETGKILPAEYGPWRVSKLYNPFADIRQNLFNNYHKDTKVTRPTYCAHYEITESRPACKLLGKQDYEVGATVCVECEPFAMKKHLGTRCRGHGVYQRDTHWNAVTVPGCHGKWKMIERLHEDCTCDMEKEPSYILI